ncbi:MAG: hypothetical protein OEU68_04605 [Nitrospira sp.]|jgi:hypothetical protein|nr:hypothetical protein [Nitrospira sp.]MDH4242356.1 hypothetical protein [Nitrospira sp.]MDH4355633.1 hypothetical protein [Nitrospira sp.]MDH5316865.1 hypothetical protein [Nitrospira sp.]
MVIGQQYLLLSLPVGGGVPLLLPDYAHEIYQIDLKLSAVT